MTTESRTPPSVLPTEGDVDAWEGSSFDLRQGLDVIEMPPAEEPSDAGASEASSPPT
jgi:hypothetical protein